MRISRGMMRSPIGRIPGAEITRTDRRKDRIRSHYNSCQKKPGSRLLTSDRWKASFQRLTLSFPLFFEGKRT